MVTFVFGVSLDVGAWNLVLLPSDLCLLTSVFYSPSCATNLSPNQAVTGSAISWNQ
jgi:hypothetical protein